MNRRRQHAECEECGAPAVWRILRDGGDRQAANGYPEATAYDCDYCDECWQQLQDEGKVCWYAEERIQQEPRAGYDDICAPRMTF